MFQFHVVFHLFQAPCTHPRQWNAFINSFYTQSRSTGDTYLNFNHGFAVGELAYLRLGDWDS